MRPGYRFAIRLLCIGAPLLVLGLCWGTWMVWFPGLALVTAAVVAATQSRGGPGSWTPGPYEVILMSAGDSPDTVVQVIGEMLGYSPAESADIVGACPALVVIGVSYESACAIRESLDEEGASTELADKDVVYIYHNAFDFSVYNHGPYPRTRLWPSGYASPVNWAAGPFQVTLTSAGKRRVQVVNRVKQLCGLDLKPAHDVVLSPPSLLAHGVSEQDATSIKAAVEAEGARVRIATLTEPATPTRITRRKP